MTDSKEKPDTDMRDTPPWLMPVDEAEEVEGANTSATGKIIAFGAVIFVILSLAGLVYLYTAYQDDDQSPKHVSAATTPIKVKPKDPGGRAIPDQDKRVFDQMQGRGGLSATVNITQQPEQPIAQVDLPQKIAQQSDDKKSDASVMPSDVKLKAMTDDRSITPSVKTAAKSEKDGSAVKKAKDQQQQKPSKSLTPSQTKAVKNTIQTYGFYRVQLGSFVTEKSAITAWRTIRGKHYTRAKDLKDYISHAIVGGKSYYRLSVGPLEQRADADNLCLYFKTRSQPCFVVSPSK